LAAPQKTGKKTARDSTAYVPPKEPIGVYIPAAVICDSKRGSAVEKTAGIYAGYRLNSTEQVLPLMGGSRAVYSGSLPVPADC